MALVGASVERSRPPASGDAAAVTTSPAVEASASEPKRAAWLVARRVASATDAGRPGPEVPGCEEALDAPTDRRCAAYEGALRDFLEDAWRKCDEQGYVRAEDFSCVPKSYFDDEEPDRCPDFGSESSA